MVIYTKSVDEPPPLAQMLSPAASRKPSVYGWIRRCYPLFLSVLVRLVARLSQQTPIQVARGARRGFQRPLFFPLLPGISRAPRKSPAAALPGGEGLATNAGPNGAWLHIPRETGRFVVYEGLSL